MIFVTSSFKPLKPNFFFYSSWVAKYVTRERKLFLSSKYHLLYVISYHPMNLIRENTSKRPFFEMGILSLAFFLFITSSNKKTILTSCKHCKMFCGTFENAFQCTVFVIILIKKTRLVAGFEGCLLNKPHHRSCK